MYIFLLIVVLAVIAVCFYWCNKSKTTELETSIYENPLHNIVVTENENYDNLVVTEKDLENVEPISLPFDYDIPSDSEDGNTEPIFKDEHFDFTESRTSDGEEFVTEANNTYPEMVSVSVETDTSTMKYVIASETNFNYSASNDNYNDFFDDQNYDEVDEEFVVLNVEESDNTSVSKSE